MLRIHKEVEVNDHWEHESAQSIFDVSAEDVFSILERYCLGTLILPDEHFGSTLTSLDFQYSEKNIKSVLFLQAADIHRFRKVWPKGPANFDSVFGYFLWESGDVASYPDVMAENRELWHFSNYRMFIWEQ